MTVPDCRYQNHLQPSVLSLLDDRQHDQRYPHIHSIWHVPGPVTRSVGIWLNDESPDGAAQEWKCISEGGTLDCQPVTSTETDIHRVCSYSGKFLPVAEKRGFSSEAFCRIYPDRS
jgi:hypothetical protein